MRVRTKIGPSVPALIPLGNTQLYKWVNPPGRWVLQSITSHYSGMALNRVTSLEACTDEIHTIPYADGPFEVSKFRYSHYKPKSIQAEYVTAMFRYKLAGAMIPNFNPVTPTLASNWSAVTGRDWFNSRYSDVLSKAATSYNKFSPLKPRVDLGQTLAEIGEIPAMLKSSAKYFRDVWKRLGGGARNQRHIPWYNQGKNTAGQWLNLNFGWVPFLGTISDCYETTMNINKIIDRLIRKNGVWEKRGGIVDETLTSDVVPDFSSSKSHMTWPSISSALEGGGTCCTTKRVVRTSWFEADYRYYIPNLSTKSRWPVSLITQLYGLNLSPKLVYDLIPYSWLLDWVTGLGNIIEANSPNHFGQLVTRKACLMDHIHELYVIDVKRLFKCGPAVQAEWTVSAESKRRHVQPSPFGFDVPLTGLSTWQTSILAALGWSKVKLRF